MASKNKVTQRVDQAFTNTLGGWWNGLGRTTRNWVIYGFGFGTCLLLGRFGLTGLNFLYGN